MVLKEDLSLSLKARGEPPKGCWYFPGARGARMLCLDLLGKRLGSRDVFRGNGWACYRYFFAKQNWEWEASKSALTLSRACRVTWVGSS